MTSLVSQSTTRALPIDTGLLFRAFDGLREFGRDCASAVRVSATSPHSVGTDPAVVRMLGRS